MRIGNNSDKSTEHSAQELRQLALVARAFNGSISWAQARSVGEEESRNLWSCEVLRVAAYGEIKGLLLQVASQPLSAELDIVGDWCTGIGLLPADDAVVLERAVVLTLLFHAGALSTQGSAQQSEAELKTLLGNIEYEAREQVRRQVQKRRSDAKNASDCDDPGAVTWSEFCEPVLERCALLITHHAEQDAGADALSCLNVLADGELFGQPQVRTMLILLLLLLLLLLSLFLLLLLLLLLLLPLLLARTDASPRRRTNPRSA